MAGTKTRTAPKPLAAGAWAAVWSPRVILLVVSGILMVVDLYLIFMRAPTDANLGHVQRVLYFHVPLAWIAYLAFFMVSVSSVFYLWKRSPRWDNLAHSSAEIGVIFISLTLATGIIWMKPVWGVWWTWEPRLTTTLILWLIYVAYLMLRAYAPSPNQGARYSAVLGVVGFVAVILNYFAVRLWQGVHPEAVTGPLAAAESIDPTMRTVLYFSVLAFTSLFVFFLMERVSLRSAEQALGRLKYSVRRIRSAQ